jgi:hypothetical protein
VCSCARASAKRKAKNEHVQCRGLNVSFESIDDGFSTVKIGGSVCPFDKQPCSIVGSCDDALSLIMGVDCVEGKSCSRASKTSE